MNQQKTQEAAKAAQAAKDAAAATAANGITQPDVEEISQDPDRSPASAMPTAAPFKAGITPDMMATRKDVEQQLLQGIADRKQGLEEDKNLYKASLAKPVQTDLSPLFSVAKAIGVQGAGEGYKAPANETPESLMKLRAALEKAQGGVTDDQENFLKYQLSKSLVNQNPYQQQRTALMQERLAGQWGKQMSEALDPSNAKNSTVFGKNANIVNAAGRLMVLAEQNPTLNFSAPQMTELATSAAALLANGSQSAQAQIEHLLPRTVGRNAADILNWLTNEPHGTNQMEFAKQMLETASRESALAAKNIYADQLKRVSGFQRFKKMSPIEHDMIRDTYVKKPTELVSDVINSIKNGTYQPTGVDIAYASKKEDVPKLPQIGEVVDGHPYLGGDPAKKTSWGPKQ